MKLITLFTNVTNGYLLVQDNVPFAMKYKKSTVMRVTFENNGQGKLY